MKYFNNITSLDELKKAYRRLAMKYHPDCGGSEEIMKQINAEHDALFETLKASHNALTPWRWSHTPQSYCRTHCDALRLS